MTTWNDNIPWFVYLDDIEGTYSKGKFVALDFETDTDLNGSALLESNDIVLACWQVWEDGVCIKQTHKWGGIFEMSELLDDISSVDFLLSFNAKFELQWLKRCGLELRDVLVYDPMLVQWVLDGNRKGKGYERSLRGMARRYGAKPKLDIVGKLMELGVSTRAINSHWLLEYCHRDVDSMVEIFWKQIKEVSNNNQWHLVHTRHLTCAVLADIEFAGLQLDKEAVEAEYIKVQTKIKELGDELSLLTGGVKLSSPPQLGVYLYDTLKFDEVKDHRGKLIKTGKGARATASPVIAQLEAKTEEQRRFLSLYKEYNKAVSLLEKNLDYFKLVCEYDDGVFYGQIKQNATGTHRLASSGFKKLFPGRKAAKGIQLQNIPREYKGLFYAADDDYVICSYDSSQVEFRVAVDMGHDRVGYEEIINGVDIHTFTAQVLYENGDPEISSIDDVKERRQHSKKSTFRPLYGGGSGSDALVAYCEYFKDKYEGVSGMQQGWAEECADNKYYITPYGMRFYFDAEIKRSGYISYTTQIYNFPVQGFATGEIIPIALVHFWHKTRNLRCDIFVTIHDSIDSRVHKDDVEQVTEIARECLTTDVYVFLNKMYNYKLRTPLGLGAKAGKHWGEGEELKWDVFPDGRIVER